MLRNMYTFKSRKKDEYQGIKFSAAEQQVTNLFRPTIPNICSAALTGEKSPYPTTRVISHQRSQ
jgi:hypothetical protein